MVSTKAKTLSPEILATTRAGFIAFYRPQGWADLQRPDVDLFSLIDTDLQNLWEGWLARTRVIVAQSLDGPADLNDWFLSLEREHQKVLVDDKWALAGAAYRAGLTKHLQMTLVDIEAADYVSVEVVAPVEASQNEALQGRIALLESLLRESAKRLSERSSEVESYAFVDRIINTLLDSEEHKPALLLPPKVECEDGYPSDDQQEAWAVNCTIDKIASMNGHLKCEVVVNSNSPSPSWPRLRSPAKVGAVIFNRGVSSRLVVNAAERNFAFSQKPGQEDLRMENFGNALNDLHDKDGQS